MVIKKITKFVLVSLLISSIAQPAQALDFSGIFSSTGNFVSNHYGKIGASIGALIIGAILAVSNMNKSAEIKDLTDQKARMKKEADENIDRCMQLDRQLSQYTKALADIKNDLNTEKGQTKFLNDRTQDITDQLKRSKAELAALQIRLKEAHDASEKEKKSLNQQIVKLDNENSKLHLQLCQLEAQSKLRQNGNAQHANLHTADSVQ